MNQENQMGKKGVKAEGCSKKVRTHISSALHSFGALITGV